MKTRHQFSTFALLTIVLVLVFGWVARRTWQELDQVHQGFASVQTEDLYLARNIDVSVHELNEIVLRICLRRNSMDETNYQQLSHRLTQWIGAYKGRLSIPKQDVLLDQIESAYSTYLAQNARLMDGDARANPSPPAMPVLEMVQTNAAPVLDLCRQLVESEHSEQTQFLKDSQLALAWIRRLLAVLLIFLLLSAGTALVAINRGVIDPLRLKLMETRALAARNEKLASLGTLAAGVAHEIRNPLTAINVRLHSLKKNLAANSSEQEDALVIAHEIQRLERIVHEFLQFARPAEPKLLTLSADSLLAKVQTLFASQLAKASIQLKVESVPDIWVRADPYQIEQVLINLVQNAAESMEGGGTITVRARIGKGRLGGSKQPAVILEVSDTGKGIPPEVKKRMFDPFFTTKEEGTGLGLAISLRIVEKHGGTLECRSEVNRGTTFAILLPYAKPDENHEFTI